MGTRNSTSVNATPQSSTSGQQTRLRRSLGLTALTFYGVGDILGAGIYALIGVIAGIAGTASWLSFLLAMGVAIITGLAYAELGGRFPRSGGESYFCQLAFRSSAVGFIAGWLVFCSGVVSLATVARAFAGYCTALLPTAETIAPNVAESAVIIVLLGGLAAIVFAGMTQSSVFNIVCTCVEVGGLLLIIAAGAIFIRRGTAPVVVEQPPGWLSIAQGGALAFFAFIGFEDIVNVGEEVKSPKRNVPLAIIAAALIAGGIYILVVLTATSVIAPGDLAQSKAPLTDVMQRAAPATPAWLFTAIALFAVANTGLLNFVMTSRLLYGMCRQNLLPSWFGVVHPRRQTPHRSILLILLTAVAMSLSGTLAYLAATTSMLILIVFFSVNLSLIIIKRRSSTRRTGFRVPFFVPVCGACSCLILCGFMDAPTFYTTGAALGIGIGVLAVSRWFRKQSSTR